MFKLTFTISKKKKKNINTINTILTKWILN